MKPGETIMDHYDDKYNRANAERLARYATARQEREARAEQERAEEMERRLCDTSQAVHGEPSSDC